MGVTLGCSWKSSENEQEPIHENPKPLNPNMPRPSNEESITCRIEATASAFPNPPASAGRGTGGHLSRALRFRALGLGFRGVGFITLNPKPYAT